jgi:aspartyl protease family protein
MITRPFLAGLLLLGALAAQAADVAVEALLPGLAVLQIDGQRVTLRAGQSHGEVTLLTADASSALLRVGGQEQRLGVSERISTQFTRPERPEISVRRDAQLQYRTTAEINGVRLPVLVDTGANIVALNAEQARAIGIAPDEGIAGQVETAGSMVPARQVMLDSVVLGGIRVDAVAATVIDGPLPTTALLGMTFLRHVEMQEQNGVLTLKGRW